MKLRQAIANADMLRPNALDESIKASWVYELEGEIAELMDKENNTVLDGQQRT